ncbi:MAG: hypothetical protein RSA24_03695, partial [Clostridia bacterium]
MAKMLKAEMWDKMQYLFRNFYDRMVHSVLYYDTPIDIEAFKQVLIWTLEKEPVLHSSFHGNVIDPYWTVEEYNFADFLTVKVDCEDLEAEMERFITGNIPTDSNVQIRFGVLSDGKKWGLGIYVNHMCMDGGDFKYFIKTLIANYNKKVNGERGFEIKTGSRSYDAVYSKLTPEEIKVAKSLYKNISAVKDEHYFPLTKDTEGDVAIINRRKVPSEIFKDFRKIGKTMDVTVNDLMLAFYIRSLYQIGMFRNDESLAIPCMVDLRRHIVEGGANTGLTNHTGFMVCKVDGIGDTINDTLLKVLQSIKESKNDPYMGLYSLPLLKLAYAIFPYIISETAIKIGYLNPLIGMSNIGVLDAKALAIGGA